MSRAPNLSTERLRQLLPMRGFQRGIGRPALDFEQARRAPGPAGWFLLLLGGLACAGLALRSMTLSHELDARRSAANAPQARSAVPRPVSKALAQQAELADGIMARLSMPWDAWFRQLEGAAKGKVTLTALQPEADGRKVRIAGEARRFDDLVEYMMRLESTPGFAHVFLNEHAETGAAISFVLSADWVGTK